MKKIDDIEMVKLLLDQRKKGILDVAVQPITVKEMAQQLNEKPSRLYYHVKKLEEAGLLELVETRQIGNLLEKFYKKTSIGPSMFEFSEDLLKNYTNTIMGKIREVLQPGLKLLSEELHQDRLEDFDKQVNLTISFSELTGKEWSESHERMIGAMRGRKTMGKEELKDISQSKLTDQEQSMKSKYAYFLLSYRIEDTQEN